MSEEIRTLPERAALGMPLGEALARRRSVRAFTGEELTGAELAALLYAAAGITDGEGHRASPSAMGYKSCRVYAVTKEAVWRFDEDRNALVLVRRGDRRAATTAGQDFVKTAPLTVAIVCDRKRQADMPDAYPAMDAGAVSENLYLAAAALGLGSVVRGWFDAKTVREELGLAESEVPLLMQTVGHPAAE